MYSDFAFYSTTYCGTLAQTVYNRLAPRASAEIDRMTHNRAHNAAGDTQTAIKYAECAVIDELHLQSVGGAGDVVSESNDGISRSYSVAAAKSPRQRISAAAETYLCNTDLLAVPI